MGEILPISKSEVKRLEFTINELKDKYRKDIEEKMMNNGFATASILNFDNDTIVVEIKYGVSVAIPESCFSEKVKINRHIMQAL